MSLQLRLKPVSAGGRGQGKGHPGSPRGALALPPADTPRATQGRPSHPLGAERNKAAAAPQLCVGLDALLGVVSLPFSASDLWGCGFFLFIPAWKARGLHLFLLLPQELGARKRDDGQGRCPSTGNSIWWPEFGTGPAELPLPLTGRTSIQPLRVEALLVFPDTR